MKKFAIALLAVASVTAKAEWTYVGSANSEGGYKFYIDTSTIKRNGTRVKAWEMQDFNIVQRPDDVRYKSVKTLVEVDCNEDTIKTMWYVFHSGPMGSGEAIGDYTDDGKRTPIPPKSVYQGVQLFLCKPR